MSCGSIAPFFSTTRWEILKEDVYEDKMTGETVEEFVYKDKMTGETFGSFIHDPKWKIRLKLMGLSIGSLYPVIERLFTRIVSVLFLEFVGIGRFKASKKYECICQEWSIEKQQKGKEFDSAAPTEALLHQLERKYILWQLAKYVLQIITFPLQAVSLFFVCLYGAIINPLHGRQLYSKILDIWSGDYLIPETEEKDKEEIIAVEPRIPLIDVDYAPPCMVSDTLLRKIKWGRVNYQTMRSRLRDIEFFVKENAPFFDREFAGFSDRILERVDLIRTNLSQSKLKDRQEYDVIEYEYDLFQNPIRRRTKIKQSIAAAEPIRKILEAAKNLKEVQGALKEIISCREAIFLKQKNRSNLNECEAHSKAIVNAKESIDNAFRSIEIYLIR